MFKQYKHVSQYKRVSEEYEKGELFKAQLIAHAQRLLVCTASAIMSCALVQYVIDWVWSFATIGFLLVLIVGSFIIAMLIEIGVILGTAMVRKNVKSRLGWLALLLGTVLSATGSELFFGKLAEHQPLEIHVAFAFVGLFVPILQITFELNKKQYKTSSKKVLTLQMCVIIFCRNRLRV